MKKCDKCGKPATKKQNIVMEIIPDNPQYDAKYENVTTAYYFCDKHALHIETVEDKDDW